MGEDSIRKVAPSPRRTFIYSSNQTHEFRGCSKHDWNAFPTTEMWLENIWKWHKSNISGPSASRETQHRAMSVANQEFISSELNLKISPTSALQDPQSSFIVRGRSESISNKRSWRLKVLFSSLHLCSLLLWLMGLGKQLLLCVNIIMQIREIVLECVFFFLFLLSGLHLVTASSLAADKDQLRAQTAALKATLGLKSPELLRFPLSSGRSAPPWKCFRLVTDGSLWRDIMQKRMHQKPRTKHN